MTDVPIDDLRDLVARWDDVRADLAEHDRNEGDGYTAGHYDGMAEGARSAAMELQRVIDRHATVWLVCRTCATERHGTDDERPHETVTDSEPAADLFRMGHYGHKVREAVVG